MAEGSRRKDLRILKRRVKDILNPEGLDDACKQRVLGELFELKDTCDHALLVKVKDKTHYDVPNIKGLAREGMNDSLVKFAPIVYGAMKEFVLAKDSKDNKVAALFNVFAVLLKLRDRRRCTMAKCLGLMFMLQNMKVRSQQCLLRLGVGVGHLWVKSCLDGLVKKAGRDAIKECPPSRYNVVVSYDNWDKENTALGEVHYQVANVVFYEKDEGIESTKENSSKRSESQICETEVLSVGLTMIDDDKKVKSHMCRMIASLISKTDVAKTNSSKYKHFTESCKDRIRHDSQEDAKVRYCHGNRKIRLHVMPMIFASNQTKNGNATAVDSITEFLKGYRPIRWVFDHKTYSMFSEILGVRHPRFCSRDPMMPDDHSYSFGRGYFWMAVTKALRSKLEPLGLTSYLKATRRKVDPDITDGGLYSAINDVDHFCYGWILHNVRRLVSDDDSGSKNNVLPIAATAHKEKKKKKTSRRKLLSKKKKSNESLSKNNRATACDHNLMGVVNNIFNNCEGSNATMWRSAIYSWCALHMHMHAVRTGDHIRFRCMSHKGRQRIKDFISCPYTAHKKMRRNPFDFVNEMANRALKALMEGRCT